MQLSCKLHWAHLNWRPLYLWGSEHRPLRIDPQAIKRYSTIWDIVHFAGIVHPESGQGFMGNGAGFRVWYRVKIEASPDHRKMKPSPRNFAEFVHPLSGIMKHFIRRAGSGGMSHASWTTGTWPRICRPWNTDQPPQKSGLLKHATGGYVVFSVGSGMYVYMHGKKLD